MEPKLRIGIVGLGYWGPKLVDIFKNLGVLEVICDMREDLLAEISTKSGIRGVSNFSEMLGSVDAVILTTPPATHFKLAKEALEKGKHVFVEKPLTTSAKEAQELVDIAKMQGKILFVDHTFCYDGVFRVLKEKIAAGEFGKLHYGKFEWLGARPKPQGPDVLLDSGPHAFAALYYLMGVSPLKVSAHKIADLETGVLSALSLQVDLRDGSKADVVLAWKDQKIDGREVEKAARVTLRGNKEVVYEGSFGSRQALIKDGGDFTPMPGITYDDEPLKNACKAFVDAVNLGTAPVSDGVFGGEIVKMLEATRNSLSSGKTEEVFDHEK